MQDSTTFQRIKLLVFFSDLLSAFIDLFKDFVSAYHVLGAE